MTEIILTETMFSTGQPFSQGEVNIWLKKYAPKELLKRLDGLKFSEMKLDGDQLILGHSETGHHHVLEPVAKNTPISKAAKALIDGANETFLELQLMESCKLVHLRGHDAHATFVLPAGEYIRGLREEQQGPSGWRVSRD